MESTFKKVEAVAVYKTHERLQSATSVFKCNAVLDVSTPVEFCLPNPVKSILKKTECGAPAIMPRKHVVFNEIPQFNFIERVLIDWEKFQANKQKTGHKTKKYTLPRLPCAERWTRLAVINNVKLPIGRAAKRKADDYLEQPGKRRRIDISE